MERMAGDLGLRLSHSKSEVICADDSTGRVMLQASPDLCMVHPEQATLLGSAIGDQAGVDSSIRSKTQALEVMGSRLHYLQDLMLIAVPKVLYILRTTLCFLSPDLPSFNLLLRSLLNGIININLSEHNRTWVQTSLPVGFRGLGIRSLALLEPSPFWPQL